MKILILLSLVAFATALDFHKEWSFWKQMYKKEYKEEVEELHRHTIWLANKKLVESHNSVADKLGYTLGMNEFGDLTSAEFVQIFNGYKMQERSNSSNMFISDPNVKLPLSKDWRAEGAVTGVKNQGQCGSCWSFSATGSLEGQHFLKDKQLVSLSEQNLIDCSKSYGNNGCKGGIMDAAFRYIEHNRGIDTEASYPYLAKTGTRCLYNPSYSGATMHLYRDIQRGNELALQQASASIGPISVAIDASRRTFQLYKSGVYYDPYCSSTKLDHGVLVIGFGSEDGQDYFLVKNSWGTVWGMEGYIKMSRNRDNNCGIATQASYPII